MTDQLIIELAEALNAVEWVYVDGAVACPWCKGKRIHGHYQDCQRQAVMAKVCTPVEVE